MKEIKMTQTEKYTMFRDSKNQYSENEYTTQSKLQTQRNPYQATNGIFHRTATNNFTICTGGKKKPWIYNGEKIISLRSSAGKTGQPLVKEWN